MVEEVGCELVSPCLCATLGRSRDFGEFFFGERPVRTQGSMGESVSRSSW